jgi:hypothetical protein
MKHHEYQPNTADEVNILRQGFKEQNKNRSHHSALYELMSIPKDRAFQFQFLYAPTQKNRCKIAAATLLKLNQHQTMGKTQVRIYPERRGRVLFHRL